MRRSPRRGRPARGSATLVIVLVAVVGLSAPLNAVASAQTPAGRAASPSLHRPATRAAARVVPTVSVIADPATAVVVQQTSCGDDDLIEPGAFVFTRDDPTGPLPVGYTLGGDAVAGRDYAALPGEVAFADGQTSVTVPVVPPPTLSGMAVLTAVVSARPGYRVGVTGTASVALHGVHVDCFPNTLWIKNRIRGDAPNPPAFSMRLQCSGRGGAEEHLLTFTDQTVQTVRVPATRNLCVLKEIDAGGAASVEYFARSASGDATSGPRSARVEFGARGGGYARLRVTNRFSGSCPTTPPNYC